MITKEDLSEITEHIHSQFNQWIKASPMSTGTRDYAIEHTERIVRVEEELKNQRELMKQGFELMDKRFGHVESRLTELSRRMFQFMIWSFGFTATSAGIIIAVLKF